MLTDGLTEDLTEDNLPPQHPGPLAARHPGPRPPWWRFAARRRWQRSAARYTRSYLHHEVFLLCIERRIPMPNRPEVLLVSDTATFGWQVWVSEDLLTSTREPRFRFNARFAIRARAEEEIDWYHAHGYFAYTIHDATSWTAPRF
jgi:hypothetical protein